MTTEDYIKKYVIENNRFFKMVLLWLLKKFY